MTKMFSSFTVRQINFSKIFIETKSDEWWADIVPYYKKRVETKTHFSIVKSYNLLTF